VKEMPLPTCTSSQLLALISFSTIKIQTPVTIITDKLSLNYGIRNRKIGAHRLNTQNMNANITGKSKMRPQDDSMILIMKSSTMNTSTDFLGWLSSKETLYNSI
jgi:hypothetical protein